MPRKKQPQQDILPDEPLELLDALGSMLGPPEEAMLAVIELERVLLSIAHELAGKAIRMDELQDEQERVAAAHRHVQLLGELHAKLQDAIQPNSR